jgi:8-oxo-dGTP diphosphatase
MAAASQRFTVEPRTLVFLLNDDAVLLIERSPNARLFPGHYNGIGGHVERGEDILTSAVREIREEAGLEVAHLELRGVLCFGRSQYRDAVQPDREPGALVFIFVGQAPHRRVAASNEGRLHWVPLDRLHTVPVMPDLADLLALVAGRSPAEGPVFLVG